MIVDLKWEVISEDVTFQLRDLAEKYSEEETYHILLVGDNNTGKTTFINSISEMKHKHLPTVVDGVELSLLTIGKSLVHIWSVSSGDDIIYQIQEDIKMLDGVFGFFDLTSVESFHSMQDRVSELILAYEKMYPLILIGNKADSEKTLVKKEDVLVFAYELGNCSCHRVPYAEMSSLKNIGLEKVVMNLINMINCNLTQKCAEHVAQVRQWCSIPQYYSFYNEARQKLEVIS